MGETAARLLEAVNYTPQDMETLVINQFRVMTDRSIVIV